MADFVTTVGFDDRQVDRGLQTVDRKFNVLGTKLEGVTAGARKFTGALSSSIGVATGVVGAIGAATGGVLALGKAYEFVAGYQERLLAAAQEYADTLRASRQIVSGFAAEGQRSRGDISGADAARLDARAAAEQARNRVLEQFITLNAAAVEGLENEAQAAQRVGDLRERIAKVQAELEDPRIADDRERVGFLELLLAKYREQLEVVQRLQVQLRAVSAEEQRRLDYIDEQAAKERAAAGERSAREKEEHERRMRFEQEREASAREREERQRAAAQREAADIRTQVELDELRARGLDDQADALERERDLRRRIREIEDAEGIIPAERRDLIERAKETARLEAEAAKQKKAAADAGGESVTGRPGGISIGAGVGGGAVLQRQVLGAGGTAAEQQQLVTQRNIARAVENIQNIIDRLASQGRGIIA